MAHLGDGGADFPNKSREVRYLDMGQDRPSKVSNVTPRRLDFDLWQWGTLRRSILRNQKNNQESVFVDRDLPSSIYTMEMPASCRLCRPAAQHELAVFLGSCLGSPFPGGKESSR